MYCASGCILSGLLEAGKKGNVLKGNGERFTTDRSNEMYERSCQSQQGWQRAILYMDMIHEWDATLLPKVQIDVVV